MKNKEGKLLKKKNRWIRCLYHRLIRLIKEEDLRVLGNKIFKINKLMFMREWWMMLIEEKGLLHKR
jgi:hypothetical protein